MSTILCPVDFSENSINALRYALCMNEILGASLVVMHVYESPALYSSAKFAVHKDLALFREAQAKFDTVYDGLIRGSAFHKIRTSSFVTKGVPWMKVVNAVKTRNVRLTVMAASSQSPAERLILGSNTTGVIKRAGSMVMIIPPGSEFKGIDRIVYGSDLGTGTKKAQATLGRLAKKLDAAVKTVHINVPATKPNDPKTARALADPSFNVLKADTVEKGLSVYMQKVKGDCLALLHRPRKFFGVFNNTSISKRLSFRSEKPLLILHEGDRVF